VVYDSALALDNNFPEIWNNRGEALMTLGRYSEAFDSFDKALEIAPDYAKAKENRNLTLSKLK
jgi:lipoprotein NlpI